MRIAMFYHSMLSDWGNADAHFLRGIVSELKSRGHEVRVYEPREGWSITNLLAEQGFEAIHRFRAAYPGLDSIRYDIDELDLAAVCRWAHLVIAHEWNEPRLLASLGQCRQGDNHFRLLFHDTGRGHIAACADVAPRSLPDYDAVLAAGDALRDAYLREGWTGQACTWLLAADTKVFRPIRAAKDCGELVWMGNWTDDERAEGLREFLHDPVRDLCLRATVHGVGYPSAAKAAMEEAGIKFGGWLPNFDVPRAFSRFQLTLHIPRRTLAKARPGTSAIGPLEAMACGIPLICAPWKHPRGAFAPGEDYLIARDGRQMREHIQTLLNNPASAKELSEHGRQTVLARHTCAHRVDELFEICRDLKLEQAFESLASAKVRQVETFRPSRAGAYAGRAPS